MKLGIAAVSSPFDRKIFEAGVSALRAAGFEIALADSVYESQGYLAGSDRQRADSFMSLFEDRSVDAILFARGGYGASRILPYLNTPLLRKNAKPVVGFSDLTGLLHFLRRETGSPVLYGPVVTQLGNHPAPRTMETLKHHLSRKEPLPSVDLRECTVLQSGSATADLTGGCLTLLSTSLGTAAEADFKNTILFFEDVHEPTYKIDRILTQFKLSGKLKKVRGILIGSLQSLSDEKHPMAEMLRDVLSDFQGPIVSGFPSGHTDDFVSLPFGRKVTLDADSRKLTFHEALRA